MNSTIAKLADEFEKMEKTIASQKKMIETLMPTGYVDTDTVKLHLNSVYGVMFGGRPSPKRCKQEDCSWDEINMYSSFGLADKMFEVGDTKKFRLADAEREDQSGRRYLPDEEQHGLCGQAGGRVDTQPAARRSGSRRGLGEEVPRRCGGCVQRL